MPKARDRPTTYTTSAMQGSSSDEVFAVPGGSDRIVERERPSSLPPIPPTPLSAVPSSSDLASAGGAEKNSATPVNSHVSDPPA